jgi:hypothetical protein
VHPLSVATGHAPARKRDDQHRQHQADAQQLAQHITVASACSGSPRRSRMRSTLIDTAPNTSPASAAEAPAPATKKSVHWLASYAVIGEARP